MFHVCSQLMEQTPVYIIMCACFRGLFNYALPFAYIIVHGMGEECLRVN
jgi:hypothetical protein